VKRPKMTNLVVEETSGVDHPAHLHPGWIVMKSSDQAEVAAVVESLLHPTEEAMPDVEKAETPDVTVESLQEELAKAREEIETLRGNAETVAPEPSEDDLVKSAPEPVQKMLEDLRTEREAALAKAADAEAALVAEREAAADAAAIAKARDWSNLAIDAEKVGPALRHLADVDADLAKAITEVLDAANAQSESAAIFEELGKSSGPSEGDAFSRMTALAKAAVEAGTAPTFEQAFATVAVSNPDLYAAHLSEKGA
jgi:hypothetical protein